MLFLFVLPTAYERLEMSKRFTRVLEKPILKRNKQKNIKIEEAEIKLA
jgi:hypothetical protein